VSNRLAVDITMIQMELLQKLNTVVVPHMNRTNLMICFIWR